MFSRAKNVDGIEGTEWWWCSLPIEMWKLLNWFFSSFPLKAFPFKHTSDLSSMMGQTSKHIKLHTTQKGNEDSDEEKVEIFFRSLWITFIWWHIKTDFPLRSKHFISFFFSREFVSSIFFRREFQVEKIVCSPQEIFGLYFMALRKSKSHNTIMISRKHTLIGEGSKVESLNVWKREKKKEKICKGKSQVCVVIEEIFGRFTFITSFSGRNCFVISLCWYELH